MSRFEGTDRYIATDDLKVAVNAAVALERPLLIKGEPGTGKTVLAYEIAKAFGAPLITWHVKSTTKAHNGLYEYDAVSRLRDSQLGDPRVSDIANMIDLSHATMGNIWQNITVALGLKAVFLVTTVIGVTGLWPAILADTGATVLVTMNAMRLLAWKGRTAE